MAEFLSHYIFGQEILELMPDIAKKSAQRYKTAYNWGLQGPDPFYYYSAAFGSPFKKYGNIMHSEKTDALFYAFSRAVNRFTDERQAIAEAYFFGFLAHYALDSTIHPYVFCRQVEFKKEKQSVNESSIHCRIENDIDYEFYKEKYKTPITDFDIDEYYSFDEQECATITVLMHYVLKSVYEIQIPTKKIKLCFEHMKQILKLLYNKNQYICKGMKRLEILSGEGTISGHFKTKKPDWDCLNLEHKMWVNLWQPEIIKTKSVPQLFDEACKKAIKLVKQYSSELDTGWLLFHHFEVPFDNGNPKNRIFKRLN